MNTGNSSSDTLKKNSFRKYLEEKKEREKHKHLKKELLDYIVSSMKEENINYIPKNLLNKIEYRIENMVNDTLDETIHELKKKELRDMIIDENIHFDRYEIPDDDEEIIFLDKLPESEIHFDRYEMPK